MGDKQVWLSAETAEFLHVISQQNLVVKRMFKDAHWVGTRVSRWSEEQIDRILAEVFRATL